MNAGRKTREQPNGHAILDAAAEEFAAHGFSGTTLDAVARRLKLTRQGVLHYYPSKPLLFKAVLDREKQWAARTALGAPVTESSPLGGLAGFLGGTPDSRRRIALQHVLQGEAIAGNEMAREYIGERTAMIFSQVSRRVEALAADGRLATGWTPETATTHVIALVNGLQALALTDAPVDVAAAFEASIAHLMEDSE